MPRAKSNTATGRPTACMPKSSNCSATTSPAQPPTPVPSGFPEAGRGAPTLAADSSAAADKTKKAVAATSPRSGEAVRRSQGALPAAYRSSALYKTGDNGERIYLTSEEIDAERVNAKREVDDVVRPGRMMLRWRAAPGGRQPA